MSKSMPLIVRANKAPDLRAESDAGLSQRMTLLHSETACLVDIEIDDPPLTIRLVDHGDGFERRPDPVLERRVVLHNDELASLSCGQFVCRAGMPELAGKERPEHATYPVSRGDHLWRGAVLLKDLAAWRQLSSSCPPSTSATRWSAASRAAGACTCASRTVAPMIDAAMGTAIIRGRDRVAASGNPLDHDHGLQST